MQQNEPKDMTCLPTRMWTLSNGWTIIGKQDTNRIWYPFRLVPSNDGKISVSAIFTKDKYVDVLNWDLFLFELEVDEGTKALYNRYYSILWSSIILPEENKLII